jgi:GR25 family glycosyltransferase involved in LPS biosynthesis
MQETLELAYINPLLEVSIPYDQVYIMNRDKATKRWELISEQLDLAGMNYRRFPAIEGSNLALTDLQSGKTLTGKYMQDNKLRSEFRTPYLVNCKPDDESSIKFKFLSQESYHFVAGEFGNMCSYFYIWNDAKAKGYQNIIIFEDDMRPKNSTTFASQINAFISHLPPTFDLGIMDYVPVRGKLKKLPDNPYVSVPNNKFHSWSSHAIVYSAKAIEKLLSFDIIESNFDNVFHNRRVKTGAPTTDSTLEVYVSTLDFIDIYGPSEMDRF